MGNQQRVLRISQKDNAVPFNDHGVAPSNFDQDDRVKYTVTIITQKVKNS